MYQPIRSKLANTITFIISMVLVIILSAVGMFSYSYISSLTKNNITKETLLKAETISDDISNIFENANIVTEQMSYHTDIKAYLKEVKTREDIQGNPRYESVLKALIDIHNSSETHFVTWVANERANFYIDSLGVIPEEDYDVKKRPWYDVAVNSDGVAFTPPYVEWSTQRVVLSSIKSLRENDEIYGFVVVDIVLEEVPAIFERAKQGMKDISFLIDGNGMYIYHQEQEKIINSNISDQSDPLSQYYDEILKNRGELINVEYEGKSYFLTTYKIDDRGWKVVTLIDKNRMAAEIRKITLVIMSIFIIGLLISIIAVYVLVKRSTKPYEVLVEYGKDIANGDLSKNIPDFYLERTDEMGDISKSFQTIIDTFRSENDTLEQKIIEKNNELEAQYSHILETEKAASLGSLVAGIAHEINTPVGTSLSTSTYLERMASNLREKYDGGTLTRKDLKKHLEVELESLEILTGSLERAAAMISSFKQVAVDQSSDMRYVFDIQESIEGVILSLRHEYKRTKHEIHNDCEIGLQIDSYPGAYAQIITNLIMNSLKHGFESIEHGMIRVAAKKYGDSLLVTYEDNGKGMTEETISKMYDPFFTTNRAAGNSGLGMHIVYNIVSQKLKGTIQCESTVNEGVKFIINIPLIAQE